MNIFAWYHASGLNEATLNVPLLETTSVFVMLTLCLLFRLSRTGLLIAYVFFYRIGWTALQRVLEALDVPTQHFASVSYIIFGILVLTFAIVGMIRGSYSSS